MTALEYWMRYAPRNADGTVMWPYKVYRGSDEIMIPMANPDLVIVINPVINPLL